MLPIQPVERELIFNIQQALSRPDIGRFNIQGVFGRTMAQPIRSSGCRPVTKHSNARGTSETRPGNRCAISGGGVPTVSEARQTTTPPVSLNFARLSHGVRSGVSLSRCGRL